MIGLLDAFVKTSVIVTLGLIAAAMLRRRSAAVRHWVLATAIFCAAAMPFASMLMPSWTLPAIDAPVGRFGSTIDVAFTSIPAAVVQPSSPQGTTVAWPSLRRLISSSVIPLWLLGVAFNLCGLLVGMSRLTLLRSGAASAPTATMTESLAHMSGLLGLRRPVRLVHSHRHAILVTWGVLRPKIVLPADADAWPRERIDVVLAHELAHVARGDWVVQIVAEAAKGLNWFNPLFWAACARLRHESECACDDVVMNSGVDRHAYATELLELARNFGRHQQAWLPAPAMAARPSNLERRVRAMLNLQVDRGPLTRTGRWVSALALLVITLPIATFAQSGFATFSGVVVDPQDHLLPGTTVTVSDAQRNVRHETKTGRDGRFELVGLPAGDYTYEVALPGFRNLTDSLAINGQSVDRALKMQVGSLQETISVTGDGNTVTGSTQSGRVVEKRPNSACPAGGTAGMVGSIRPPHKVKDVRPGYPGVDGRIELAATIGTDGSVVDVQVVKADRPELGPAAIDAVRQWEFDSTLLNCVPIEVQMNVSVVFRHDQ